MDYGQLMGFGDWLAKAGLLGLLIVALVALVVWWLSAPARAEERVQRAARQAMEARDRARYDLERSWVAAGGWPLTHYVVYATSWEFAEDLARLKAMGYSMEWQEHTEDGIAVTYSLTPAYRQAGAR